MITFILCLIPVMLLVTLARHLWYSAEDWFGVVLSVLLILVAATILKISFPL